MDIAYARVPKQSRSRESFDRVLDAAAELLAESGASALTLAAVSRRAKASIGSIYGRVASKDHLLRAVQVRSFSKMDDEYRARTRRLRRRGLGLTALVPALIREQALFLKRHARLVGAFMERAPYDPIIQAAGRDLYERIGVEFAQVLLDQRADVRHPDPEHAVSTSYMVVHGVLARFLGLGGGTETGAGEGDWRRLVDDLGLMTLAFLGTDLRHVFTRSTPRR